MSEPERAAFRALLEPGLIDGYRAIHQEPKRFTWWDYRAGMFHKNFGMRIDHLLAAPPVAARIVDAEIDREARKGPPVPSDHAPLSDGPGRAREAVRPGLGRRPVADRLEDALGACGGRTQGVHAPGTRRRGTRTSRPTMHDASTASNTR